MNDTPLLPTLAITAKGEIITSNLAEFSNAVRARLKDFNTALRTDEDFERAAGDVATLKGAEEALEAARFAILESAGDINATLASMDDLRGEIAAKRLAIARQIDAQKAKARAGMLADALAGIACAAHLRQRYTGRIEAAIKGKRSLGNISSALRAEVEEINGKIAACQSAIDAFEENNGRAMTADRDTLELMDPETLAGELTRRKERADHEAEKRKLEADARAAEAAQAAAAATAHAAPETAPPANLPPLARAQAMAANPRAPIMIDPEPPEAEPEPTPEEEWRAFREVFFSALAPVKAARQRLRHQANIARGADLAEMVSAAWGKVNDMKGGANE